MSIKLCVLGLPGSGKTTISDKLVHILDMKCFDVGAILRSKANEDDHIKQIHQAGGLVNSDRVLNIFEEALSGDRWLLSGSPRKPEEADYVLNHPNWIKDPGYLIYLKLEPSIAKQRLLSRGRHDDNDQIINKRLEEHFSITKKSVKKFEDQGRVIVVDATQSQDDVCETVLKELVERKYINWLDEHTRTSQEIILLLGEKY